MESRKPRVGTVRKQRMAGLRGTAEFQEVRVGVLALEINEKRLEAIPISLSERTLDSGPFRTFDSIADPIPWTGRAMIRHGRGNANALAH